MHADPMQDLNDRTFEGIAALMHETIGLAFGPSKKALVSSRLAPRMQRLGIASYEDYLRRVQTDEQGELQMAIDLLTTNETYFFREPDHFGWIERELAGPRRDGLRVWSAASSFGDEAYSVAMVLADLELQGRVGPDWSVLGTDISDRVLRSACAAIFPEDRLRAVSPQRLRRYCLRGEGDSAGLAMLNERVTSHVRFGQLNLCDAIEPLGPFDIVFLRNVLIYFDAATKRAVVDRVLAQLRPGGLFFIGTAEGRVATDVPLKALGPGAFRKLDA